MQYATLGGTGLQISRLCLGSMVFGAAADETASRDLVHRALDLGVNFIDTADCYNDGSAERFVGSALGGRRDDIVLASKGGRPIEGSPFPHPATRDHLVWACEQSLRRLRTDRLDIYYLHWLPPEASLDGVLRGLEDLRQAGKALHIGCSNLLGWQIARAQAAAGCGSSAFEVAQPLYNLTNRDAEVEVLPACAELGVGVVSYSPLGRGVLTGKYMDGVPVQSRAGRGEPRIFETEYRPEALEVARRLALRCRERRIPASQFPIAWALANTAIDAVIVGPRSAAQLEDNCAALDTVLTADDEAFVDSLVPPGGHADPAFRDPLFPVTGRRIRPVQPRPS